MYKIENKIPKRILIKMIDYDVNDKDKELLTISKLDLYKRAILGSWKKKTKVLED